MVVLSKLNLFCFEFLILVVYNTYVKKEEGYQSNLNHWVVVCGC